MDTLQHVSAPGRLLAVDGAQDEIRTDRLRNRANSADLVRVRRGCYFPASAWLRSPPWDRHLIASVAAGLIRPEEIFCRETALALYGVPLLRTPDAVQLRTSSPGQVGRRRAAVITGAAPHSALAKAWHRAFGEPPTGEAWLRRFAGVDTQRIHYPRSLRKNARPGPGSQMTPDYHGALRNIAPPRREHFDPEDIHLRVEPLPLCVVDTVCRTEITEGVVILDAVLAGGHAGEALTSRSFDPWLGCIPSGRARHRWNRALDFADPGSESPGESLSRVLMSQLGFQIPTLQHPITMPDGTRYRTDFCWERAGIVGEFDGHMKYTRARALRGLEPADVVVREKTRERHIERQGYRVVRWDWQDLRTPERLRRILADYGVPRAD